MNYASGLCDRHRRLFLRILFQYGLVKAKTIFFNEPQKTQSKEKKEKEDMLHPIQNIQGE